MNILNSQKNVDIYITILNNWAIDGDQSATLDLFIVYLQGLSFNDIIY